VRIIREVADIDCQGCATKDVQDLRSDLSIDEEDSRRVHARLEKVGFSPEILFPGMPRSVYKGFHFAAEFLKRCSDAVVIGDVGVDRISQLW